MELKNKNIFSGRNCFFIGLFLFFIYYLPYFILGEGSIISVHDNLDDFVVKKMLDMKYFFEGSSFIIPNVMNGVAKPTDLNMIINIFYLFMSPFWAYIASDLVVKMTAFSGMYLLLERLSMNKGKSFFNMCVAVIFSALPMLSIHGLHYAGIPMLIYCFILLYENKKHVWAFLYIFWYVYNTLFVLIGYVVVGFAILYILWLVFSKNIKNQKWVFAGLVFLILLFVPSVLSSFVSLSGVEGFVSHRTEFNTYSTIPSLRATLSMWLDGHYHAASVHKFILVFSLVVLGAFCFYKNKADKIHKKMFYLGVSLYVLTFLIALFYGCISPLIRAWFGGVLPILNSFQYDRFYFLYPPLWYCLLAISSYLLWYMLKNGKKRTFANVVIYLVVIATGLSAVGSGYYKYNLLKLVGRESASHPSWEQFYDEELFAEIKEYIGKDVSDYRVVSLGMHPSVPLYNGFYCLDAYWLTYSLDYKHEFRKIIANELEKNEDLKGYFDNWGSRCYLFSDELGRNYLWSKSDNKSVENFEIDTTALKKLGGKYVISAVDIKNAEQTGLVKLKEFTDDDSFYKITLYQVK